MDPSEHGRQVEEQVRQIAGVLGLPDFVFTVPPFRKGNAVREVGDALLVANGKGAIVQVKARRPDAEDDGARWLAKNGKKAVNQAKGTRRTIDEQARSGEPLTAIPVRVATLGVELQQEARLVLYHDVRAWPLVIVIDHPGVVGQEPPDREAFWITLDDWHNLMLGLRSVTSLLEYVRRVMAAVPALQVPLGAEEERFMAMVGADANVGGDRGWLTVEAHKDPIAAQLYRELVERVWPAEDELPAVPMSDYRRVVDFLDAVPPGLVPEVGRWIFAKRHEQTERGSSSGTLIIDQVHALVYVARTWREERDELLLTAAAISLAIVRSAEISAQLGHFVPALAVGQLVRADGAVTYRYVAMQEHIEASVKERALVAHNFGMMDVRARRVSELSADPTDVCPCGSGLTFEECDARASGW